jgi:uncharacterized protein (TIGR00369 family)
MNGLPAMTELQSRLATIPYARFLGFEVAAEGDTLIGRLPFAESLIGNPRIRALHGGVVGATLELTAICELLRQPQTRAIPKIVTITVEYLRSAQAADLVARAEITRHGRRLASVRVTAWQDDPAKPVAAANALFLLKDAAP